MCAQLITYIYLEIIFALSYPALPDITQHYPTQPEYINVCSYENNICSQLLFDVHSEHWHVIGSHNPDECLFDVISRSFAGIKSTNPFT